jgi:hypothetical protein
VPRQHRRAVNTETSGDASRSPGSGPAELDTTPTLRIAAREPACAVPELARAARTRSPEEFWPGLARPSDLRRVASTLRSGRVARPEKSIPAIQTTRATSAGDVPSGRHPHLHPRWRSRPRPLGCRLGPVPRQDQRWPARHAMHLAEASGPWRHGRPEARRSPGPTTQRWRLDLLEEWGGVKEVRPGWWRMAAGQLPWAPNWAAQQIWYRFSTPLGARLARTSRPPVQRPARCSRLRRPHVSARLVTPPLSGQTASRCERAPPRNRSWPGSSPMPCHHRSPRSKPRRGPRDRQPAHASAMTDWRQPSRDAPCPRQARRNALQRLADLRAGHQPDRWHRDRAPAPAVPANAAHDRHLGPGVSDLASLSNHHAREHLAQSPCRPTGIKASYIFRDTSSMAFICLFSSCGEFFRNGEIGTIIKSSPEVFHATCNSGAWINARCNT